MTKIAPCFSCCHDSAESEAHVDGSELRAKSGLISFGEATDDN
jgi:hypothetical protein